MGCTAVMITAIAILHRPLNLDDERLAPEAVQRIQALIARPLDEQSGSDLGRAIDELHDAIDAANNDHAHVSLEALKTLIDTSAKWTLRTELTTDQRTNTRAIRNALLDLLAEQPQSEAAWRDTGRYLASHGRPDLVAELWRDKLDAIMAQTDLPNRATDLWCLSDAMRRTRDFDPLAAILDALDRTTSDAAPHTQGWGFCAQIATSERLMLAIELGLTDQVRLQQARYSKVCAEFPDRADRFADIMVRAHAATGETRLIAEDVARLVKAGIQPSSFLKLRLVLSEISRKRFEGQSTQELTSELRAVLSANDLDDPALIEGFFELIGCLALENDWQGAAWCVQQMRATAAPPEERAMVAALDAYVASKTGEAPEQLRTRLAELHASFDELVAAQSRRPLDAMGSGVGRFPRDTAVLGALIELETTLNGDAGIAASIESIAKHQCLSALCRQLSLTPCTLAELRTEVLQPEHGILLLQPAPTQTGGHRLIAFDGDHVRAVSIGGFWDKWRWDDLLKSELDGASAHVSQHWRDVAEQFVAYVLPAAIRELIDRWQRITLVGFDGEAWFPFECLYLGERPVGCVKDIDHWAALAHGISLARRPQPTSFDRDLLLVAAPEPSPAARQRYPDLDTLSLSSLEIDGLDRPFARGRVRRLTGADASLTEIAALRESFALLHVIAHGTPSEDAAPVHGMILAGGGNADGIAYPADVKSFPRAAVALLSVCRAGTSAVRPLEGGLNNLGGAFLANGARSVVFAHADLPVAATVQLMSLATRELGRGASPAAAMRVARTALLDQGLSNPLWHSALRVWGLGQLPVFAQPATSSATSAVSVRTIATALVLVLLLVGLVTLKRRS